MELDKTARSLVNKYLLARECKWKANENSDRLLCDFKSKAEKHLQLCFMIVESQKLVQFYL
jgi:hypothetical protein